jgi:hypothetical protein
MCLDDVFGCVWMYLNMIYFHTFSTFHSPSFIHTGTGLLKILTFDFSSLDIQDTQPPETPPTSPNLSANMPASPPLSSSQPHDTQTNASALDTFRSFPYCRVPSSPNRALPQTPHPFSKLEMIVLDALMHFMSLAVGIPLDLTRQHTWPDMGLSLICAEVLIVLTSMLPSRGGPIVDVLVAAMTKILDLVRHTHYPGVVGFILQNYSQQLCDGEGQSTNMMLRLLQRFGSPSLSANEMKFLVNLLLWVMKMSEVLLFIYFLNIFVKIFFFHLLYLTCLTCLTCLKYLTCLACLTYLKYLTCLACLTYLTYLTWNFIIFNFSFFTFSFYFFSFH